MDIIGTRRAVLGGLGAGLAASVLPRAAWGATQTKRKLGYAIVGLGNYATRQIMPRLKDCEFAELKALVSGTPAKLEQYGTEYGIPKTHRYSYADYDRIRDNPDIDLVYVVLPNSMHAEYSIRASQAGKHVLCEKPMAISAAECEAMIAAAKKANRKLMIGYRCHFEPHNLLGVKLVKDGTVGKVRFVGSEHGFVQGAVGVIGGDGEVGAFSVDREGAADEVRLDRRRTGVDDETAPRAGVERLDHERPSLRSQTSKASGPSVRT